MCSFEFYENFLWYMSRDRSKPAELIQIQNVTADFSRPIWWMNISELHSLHSFIKALLLILYCWISFYIFMSAVTTFPQVFFSARFGCYIECEEIILWYEDQSFKTELVIAYKRILSCESCILWERIVSKVCLYVKRQFQLMSDFSKMSCSKWTSVLQSRIEVASLTTFYCLTTFKQFSRLQIIAN